VVAAAAVSQPLVPAVVRHAGVVEAAAVAAPASRLPEQAPDAAAARAVAAGPLV
jgi:hypothetical protein